MAFRNWFGGKRRKDEVDPLRDYELRYMEVGFMVDYDLKTWEVIDYATYDFDGEIAEEWTLKSNDEVCYLERSEEDGEVFWLLTRRADFDDIEEDVIAEINKNDEPPGEITYNGRVYRLIDSGAGEYREKGRGVGRPFISWTYVDQAENNVMVINQWGDRDFAVFAGEYVEEYHFSNILPRGKA